MMVTRRKTVPWLWVSLAMLPWALIIFIACGFATITTFQLRKFTDSPLLISALLTIPSITGVTFTPIALYLSDHVWTRWGRRKPFVVVGGIPALLALVLIPYANSLVTLTLLLLTYYICQAGFQPFEPLTQEIVPPSQRGRASIVHTLAIQLAVLGFFWVLMGRYDDYYSDWPWSL